MSEPGGGAGEHGAPTGRGRRHGGRRVLSTVLAVVLCFTLFGGLVTLWADHAMFDRGNFAGRTTKLLESDPIRHQLAVRFTDTLIQNGPSQLAGFRAVILPAVDDLMQTPAFKEGFRRAMEEAHKALFTENGNDLVVNLSQSLGVLAGSLQISNPGVASNIPTGLDQFLVDVGEDIRGMQLWQAVEEFNQLAAGMLTASVVLGLAVVLIDTSVRRGVFKLGVGLAAAGFLVVGTTVLAPRIAAAAVSDSDLQAAVRSGVGILVGDLQVMGIWMIGYGVIAAALATASTPRHAPIDPRVLYVAARDRAVGWTPTTTFGRIGRAVLIIAVGLVLVLERTAVVPLLVALAGAYITYFGIVQLLEVVGRTQADRAVALAASDPEHPRGRHQLRWMAAAVVGLLAVLSIGGMYATGQVRSRVASASERECNGSAELCDRTIDKVAFAGSHNAMSASSEAGWLFAEQSNGIAAQLEYGVRALLVKSHYGIPTGITLTGADLVVTDRAAELAVNPKAVEQALPGGGSSSGDAATQLAASAKVDPARRDIYLCHVYCEYGATRFRTVLDDLKRFLDQNPNEVVILFIGDYVSASDTARIFQEAGLFDRLYPYDADQPPPTLGQMIDARKNVFLLSEYTGHPPDWNNPGYGLFQDTPFTFTEPGQLIVEGAAGSEPSGTTFDTGVVDDTIVDVDEGLPSGTTLRFGDDWTGEPSCAPNRGTPDSALFQVNHWVTPAGSASTVDQAKEVNAYDVLMPRVKACMTERNRFPTIVGVNFATTGDLLRVVDDLNGVG